MRTKKRLVFTLVAVLSAALSVQQGAALDSRPAGPSPSFAIIVDAAGPGISAVCERGCAWKRVSATFPGGRYRITETGIYSVQGDVQEDASDPAQPAGFSVVLTPSARGVSATCDEGCAWKTVSATYPTGTYQITQQGIEPAP